MEVGPVIKFKKASTKIHSNVNTDKTGVVKSRIDKINRKQCQVSGDVASGKQAESTVLQTLRSKALISKHNNNDRVRVNKPNKQLLPQVHGINYVKKITQKYEGKCMCSNHLNLNESNITRTRKKTIVELGKTADLHNMEATLNCRGQISQEYVPPNIEVETFRKQVKSQIFEDIIGLTEGNDEIFEMYLNDFDETYNEILNKQHESITNKNRDCTFDKILNGEDPPEFENENINIEVSRNSFCDDEFGKCDFKEKDAFTYEAYNKDDFELVKTSINFDETNDICANAEEQRVFADGAGNNLECDIDNFGRQIDNTSEEGLSDSGKYSSTNSSLNSLHYAYESEDVTDSNNRQPERIKRETYYDKHCNPIIEKVSKYNPEDYNRKNVLKTYEDTTQTHDSLLDKKSRLTYILEELIQTEEVYLRNLSIISNEYCEPLDKIQKSSTIIVIAKKIFKENQNFCKDLKESSTNYKEVARTFIKYEERLFSLYPEYFRQKRRADVNVISQNFKIKIKKIQEQLGDCLDLHSYLLTPIQRLARYIQFLEQVNKELAKQEMRSEDLDRATSIVKRYMKKGNDFVAIDSIKKAPYNLFEKVGSFIYREKFYVLKPKKYEATVFLFDQSLIITIADPKIQEQYIYKNSVHITNMGITIFKEDPLLFHIKQFLHTSKHTIEIEATSSRVKKLWTETIESLLWKQLYRCKEEASKKISKRKSVQRNRKSYLQDPEESNNNMTSSDLKTEVHNRRSSTFKRTESTRSKSTSTFFVPLE